MKLQYKTVEGCTVVLMLGILTSRNCQPQYSSLILV